MDERIARIIRNIDKFEGLSTFEKNATRQNALTEEIADAIKQRTAELGRALIADRTKIDLSDLTPAEEKIVQAVSEYVGVMKREKKDATRTFSQLRNRGLLDAAETAVAQKTPTQGFKVLADAELSELSYEQIIVDHPEEFSARALWFARRTLGLDNESPRPPARAITPVQRRTDLLLDWLWDRAEANDGLLPPHTNAEAASALGLDEMHRFGRAFGNIQARLDYACYLSNLPPLGLTAAEPFSNAWSKEDRRWAFPIGLMQAAAQTRRWSESDFSTIREQANGLPGQAHLAWQSELTSREDKVRSWAFGMQTDRTGTIATDDQSERRPPRNPVWTRDELILALDLYLRFRRSPPSKTSAEVRELSDFLGQMAQISGIETSETYRNANGVYMKMMNFRSIDPQFIADGRVGLSSNNDLENTVWKEFADDDAARDAAVSFIRRNVSLPLGETPYWVFVCNPKRWAIDRFLSQGIERDTWGIRPADRDKFAPGQLGIVRVGKDTRSAVERDGRPVLVSGIYALCQVESIAFEGTGANDRFWSAGSEREPGWPTVNIQYLRTYAERPLSIERLRSERPNIYHLLLNGFQAASFPIPSADFYAVMDVLEEDLSTLSTRNDEPASEPREVTHIEEKYLHACPEVKTRLSRYIERGPVGNAVKKANGFKCQICVELGQNPIGFEKPNGEPYVEAHHVMPVAKGQIGSLSASNIMTVCANHHRQLHYGGVEVTIGASEFELAIAGVQLRVPKASMA